TYTKGEHGQGYAVCLRCGMVASHQEARKLPEILEKHKPLRGGDHNRTSDGFCLATEYTWSLRKDLYLGTTRETDVFELQLRNPETGKFIDDEVVAISLAVALRQALANQIGVE